MTTTHIIMIVGFTVSAVVALINASQQRKQMRQIELYKQDPSVGLVPPSSALTRFVKSRWDVVLGFGGPLVGLALEFMTDTPLTRLSVLLISLNVALLLTIIVMTVMFHVVNGILEVFSQLTGVVKDNLSASKEHFEITKLHRRLLDTITDSERDTSGGT